MGLEDVFKEAAERVKQLPEATNEDQLELYSLFKQSNLGDCGTNRPGGLFNMKEKAKWDAWNERKGMDKDDAKRAYVDKLVTELGDHPALKDFLRLHQILQLEGDGFTIRGQRKDTKHSGS